MAILLCSMLLGAGYDAYVVMGRAPMTLSKGIHRSEDCPDRRSVSEPTEILSEAHGATNGFSPHDDASSDGSGWFEARSSSFGHSNDLKGPHQAVLLRGGPNSRSFEEAAGNKEADPEQPSAGEPSPRVHEQELSAVGCVHAWLLVRKSREVRLQQHHLS